MQTSTGASAIQGDGTKGPNLSLVRKAFGIRLFEESLLRLFAQGKISGTVHTCIGQEWTGVALAEYLHTADVVFSNHRCHGHYLARTGNYRGLLAEIMGRESGICGGRGGSQHICDGNVFSNGVQGGIVPVSAGIALSQKKAGKGDITAVFVGDGTLGEGVFYEALNICSLWKLPLLIILENNSYAQSTPQRQFLAGNICARPESFGIASYVADTWNVPDLLVRMGDAVSHVRQHCEPVFLEVKTYRLMAHSKGDDDRDQAEVRTFWERDPLVLFEEKYPEEASRLKSDLSRELSEALADCEQTGFARATEIVDSGPVNIEWTRTKIEEEDRVVNRIHFGLRAAMERDDRVMLLGEDVEAPYGGAFKVSKDLSDHFPGRVRNTPISEAAILGICNGLALRDMRPICEFMFGDFLLLAGDQFVNHSAKFQYMYNDKVRVPVVIRTPMGGRRGYGATHSQTLEKHLLGVPGTHVAALHNRYDPKVVYERVLATIDRPTLIIENKTMYGERVSAESMGGFEWWQSNHDLPISYLQPADPADLTFICYGGTLTEVEKATEKLFYDHELIAEIICPLQIYPLQIDCLLGRISTPRIFVVEEGQSFCGWGAEILARIAESRRGPEFIVQRISPAEQPIPSCKTLELELLPNADMIVKRTLECVFE